MEETSQDGSELSDIFKAHLHTVMTCTCLYYDACINCHSVTNNFATVYLWPKHPPGVALQTLPFQQRVWEYEYTKFCWNVITGRSEWEEFPTKEETYVNVGWAM